MATITLTSDKMVEIPIEKGLTDRQVLNRLKKIDELKKLVKDTDAEIKALQEEITGGCECTYDTARFTVTFRDEPQSRVDTARLKKELPDVAAAYTKTAPRMVFRYAFK